MVLLDYSKAFDTVWRERLLLSMHEKGVPLIYLRWIRSFLNNRQAKVRFGDALSSSKTIRQGVPQGAVLSPPLFLFYIYNLARILPSTTTNSLFADDVTVLSSNHSKEDAEENAQHTVSIVERWSREWKLTINSSKSEASFFSTCVAEAKWKPTITVEGEMIDFKPTPRLLGVILDRQLSFKPQVQEVTEKATTKLKLLAAISYSEWGWPKDSVRMMYYAFMRSKLDYASPAWQPWLSDSNMSKLESVQNRALRLATRQFRSSPVEALRAEAEVTSYKTHSERQCLKSWEKAKRMPADHPMKIALDGAVVARNRRTSWFIKGGQLSTRLEEGMDLSPICLHGAPPWIDFQTEVFAELPGVTSREVDIAIRRSAAITRINEINTEIIIYTDGSATAGTHHGGAGAVIKTGDPESPTSVAEIKLKGALHTSSYE